MLTAALRPIMAASTPSSPGAPTSPGLVVAASFSSMSSTSLIGVLLRVEPLQEALLTELLGRLVMEMDDFQQQDHMAAASSSSSSSSSSSLSKALLREIRWLEHIGNPKAMTDRLLELLDSGEGGVALQSELIAYIPEIVCDDFEHDVAERLVQLLQCKRDRL